MICTECKQEQGYFRCLDCSTQPLFCRSCCRVSHQRLHTHRIQCWNGKYFRTSALWETGLIFNLCHGGNPCPGLVESEMEEHARQDKDWHTNALRTAGLSASGLGVATGHNPATCTADDLPVGDTPSRGSPLGHHARGNLNSEGLSVGETLSRGSTLGDQQDRGDSNSEGLAIGDTPSRGSTPGRQQTRGSEDAGQCIAVSGPPLEQLSTVESGMAPNNDTSGAGGPELTARLRMAALELFDDEKGEVDNDEDYDSEDIDTLVDPEGPEQDLHDEDAENVNDHASDEYYERIKGMSTPPHPEADDQLGNPFVIIVDTNGLHYLPIHYCMCPTAQPRDEQLLQERLFPSSFTSIKTVFTFRVLDDFRMANLCCKSSCYQYFLKLRRLTCPTFPKSVPVSYQSSLELTATHTPKLKNRYRELIRVSRQWRNLELRKSFGFGHEDRSPKAGEMAYGCASCPQQGTNLPENWKDDPDQYVISVIIMQNFATFCAEKFLQGSSVPMEISRQIT